MKHFSELWGSVLTRCIANSFDVGFDPKGVRRPMIQLQILDIVTSWCGDHARLLNISFHAK